jgi:tRNA(Ile)-lysidine synthase
VCAADAAAVSAAEAKTLFDGLRSAPALILAVSGGPDSTALLVLAARWRAALKKGPALFAVTIDHGLRPESAREARAVKRLAARLGVRHRTLHWTGRKPTTGLQEEARRVRYRLLAAAARGAGAHHVLTAHTLDDQAETVLLRMARGSGLTGLGAMARESPLFLPGAAGQADERTEIVLVRPLLEQPKARLIATLAAMGITFADDPSNRDPRFTRPRLRALMPVLADEGLDARRLALLADRLRRADATIECAVDAAILSVSVGGWDEQGPVVLDADKFARLPAEVALRLLGRAIARTGDEGTLQLGKLEALYQAVHAARIGLAGGSARETTGGPAAFRLRRTLAGALVTLARDRLQIEPAPPRAGKSRRSRKALTTRQDVVVGTVKRR